MARQEHNLTRSLIPNLTNYRPRDCDAGTALKLQELIGREAARLSGALDCAATSGAYGRPFDMEIAEVTRDACTDHVLFFHNSEQ